MPTTDLRVTQSIVEQVTIKRPAINVTQSVIEYIASLGIVCNNPPAGVVGTAYSHTFLAGSGEPPYTFSITSGFLPPGLILNAATGVVSGTPTTAGTFAFTVTVTDSFTATASVNCFITITLPGGSTGVAVILYGYQLIRRDPCDDIKKGADLVEAPRVRQVKRVL